MNGHSVSTSRRSEGTGGATTSHPRRKRHLEAIGETKGIMHSQPARSTGNTTTTGLSQFAPLENIGMRSRPRTATSTTTSRLCFSNGVEIQRPATSHAKTTNLSFAQPEVEDSDVDSQPASAYPSTPQHKGSPCPNSQSPPYGMERYKGATLDRSATDEARSQPCPTKPEHVDDSVHPAYRKARRTEENVHPNLDRCHCRGQVWNVKKECQREGNSSVLLTQEQKPDVPSSPPLTTQAKQPLSPVMVSSGTSKSPHRNQELRRCKDVDQRGTANRAGLPMQGQEPRKLPSPELPPRSHTTESSRSDSSSGEAAISDMSRSRNSQDYDAVPMILDIGVRRTVGTVEIREQEPPELPARHHFIESPGSVSSYGAAAIFDRSESRNSQNSDATTIFSVTGLIATEEFDYSALLRLGARFGVARPDFGWERDANALLFAANRMQILKTGDRTQRIDGRILLSVSLN